MIKNKFKLIIGIGALVLVLFVIVMVNIFCSDKNKKAEKNNIEKDENIAYEKDDNINEYLK